MGDRIESIYWDAVIIEEKLGAFLAWLGDEKPPAYTHTWDKEILEEYNYWRTTLRKLLVDSKPIADQLPEVMDEMFMDKKIVGYWYEGTTAFLRDFAQYIEGDCELRNDAGEATKISFEDGRALYSFESRTWSDYKTDDEAFNDLPELPETEKVIRGL